MTPEQVKEGAERLMANVPANMKRLRCERKMAWTDAARAAGVSTSSWIRWEFRACTPKLEQTVRIALVLGCQVEDLLRDPQP